MEMSNWATHKISLFIKTIAPTKQDEEIMTPNKLNYDSRFDDPIKDSS